MSPDHERQTGAAKRALDVVLSAALILILSPLLLVIAIAVWLQDGGPPLYRQERVGRGGRTFSMWKFRTMVTNADQLRTALVAASGELRFKDQQDPRITPVGRILRRWSLDELPQLVSVLNGEMSLVGPRPPIPEEVAQYDARELQRLAVTPGLTGPWQVGGRSELDFDQQVTLDLEYIARRGFLYDLGLLARTIPAVLTGRGAW